MPALSKTGQTPINETAEFYCSTILNTLSFLSWVAWMRLLRVLFPNNTEKLFMSRQNGKMDRCVWDVYCFSGITSNGVENANRPIDYWCTGGSGGGKTSVSRAIWLISQISMIDMILITRTRIIWWLLVDQDQLRNILLPLIRTWWLQIMNSWRSSVVLPTYDWSPRAAARPIRQTWMFSSWRNLDSRKTSVFGTMDIEFSLIRMMITRIFAGSARYGGTWRSVMILTCRQVKPMYPELSEPASGMRTWSIPRGVTNTVIDWRSTTNWKSSGA